MTSFPEDPDDWSDEEWLAWLEASAPEEPDGDEASEEARRPAPPKRRRLGAQLIAAAMTGIEEAIYGPKDKHAIVIEASGDPPDDEPVTLDLDPEHPERSTAVVRPWLMREDEGEEDDGARDQGALPDR